MGEAGGGGWGAVRWGFLISKKGIQYMYSLLSGAPTRAPNPHVHGHRMRPPSGPPRPQVQGQGQVCVSGGRGGGEGGLTGGGFHNTGLWTPCVSLTRPNLCTPTQPTIRTGYKIGPEYS